MRNVGRSLADIIRTPLYESAMLVVSIAAIIICPFKFAKVYDFREKIGELIMKLYRNDFKARDNDLAPCFAPYRNLRTIDNLKYSRLENDTMYNDLSDLHERGLNNFASHQVSFLRNYYSPFHNPIPYFGRLKSTVRYISPDYRVLLAQKKKSYK